MRKIYKSASNVRVWLGAPDDGEDEDVALAMRLVEQMRSGVPKREPGEPEPVFPEVGEEGKLRHWRALAAVLENRGGIGSGYGRRLRWVGLSRCIAVRIRVTGKS
jgi:hypothetical protein